MNIIITAPKHLGKSTLIRKIIARLGGSTSGFISEFINRDSPDRVLMIKSIDGEYSRPVVKWDNEGYHVDYDCFDNFAAELIDADSDFVVIDELGKFEINCENLRNRVTKAFESKCHVIASVRLDALGWMQELKSRNDVCVINLTEENRDELDSTIISKLGIV